MATREGLLAEFDHEMAATRRLLSCITDETMPYRPHARSRTMAELGAHIVDIIDWSEPLLERLAFDLDDAPAASAAASTVAALVQSFAERVARARPRLDRSDAELHAMWSLRQGGQELFSLPRSAAFRTFVLGHVVHHRGQLSVYLRLNEIVVPPVYGPTADRTLRT